MKIFSLVFIFIMLALAFSVQGKGLSEEQVKFCNHSKNAWNENCSQYKKIHLKKVKEKQVLIGCEGPGMSCGAFVSIYTKLDYNKCAKDLKLDRLYYNELWQFKDKKGNLTKIYWNDGIFIYMGNENRNKYSGGTITFEKDKVFNVVEYMSQGRQWFLCEINP